MGWVVWVLMFLGTGMTHLANASVLMCCRQAPGLRGETEAPGRSVGRGRSSASLDHEHARLTASPVSPKDAFSGDGRLAIRVTIKVHDTSLTDLLADLGVQTSIRFFVDDAVSPDRVTLYAYDRPLEASLRALARCCSYAWRRIGVGPDYAYVLGRSAEADREEAQLRLRRQEMTADEVLWEAEECSRLRGMPQDVRRAEAQRLAAQMVTAGDPAIRYDLGRRYQVAASMGTEQLGREIVLEVLRVMGRDAILRAFRQDEAEMRFPPSAGLLSIPESAVAAAAKAVAPGATIRWLNIKVMHSQERNPRLRWGLVVETGDGRGASHSEYQGDLPGFPIEEAAADHPPARASLPSGFNDTATVVLQSLVSKPSPRGATYVTRPRLGDGLDALEKVHPMDLVADAFVSARLPPLGSITLTVAQLLDRLADLSGHSWRLEDGFVQVRAKDYEAMRASDPPPDAYARWVKAAQGDGLRLDDYAEMAALNDAQWATLSDLASRGDFPGQLSAVAQARPHLRLWHALDRKLRKAAMAQGVSRSQMTARQRDLLDAAAGADPGKVWRMRVEAHSVRMFAVRQGEGGLVADAASREMALQLFRRRDASIQTQDVRMVVFTLYRFNYETRNGATITHFFVNLPPHWQDAPAGS
ncbi:MAG: hypothetical protein ACP5VE_11780 [Chthonomonadales bacterium]